MIQLPDINHPIIDEKGTINREWYIALQEVVKQMDSNLKVIKTNTNNIISNDVELLDHENRITALETP